MANHKLQTAIRINIGEAEVEYNATVIYYRHEGFAGDRIDPPQGAYCELIDVFVTMPSRDPWKLGPPALLDALDAELQADMLADWADDIAAAEEARADQRRDDLMMGRF